MKIRLSHAQHVGARESQQDCYGLSEFGLGDSDPRGFVAVVADGMGGMREGGAASALALERFLEAYGAKTPDESIPDALRRALLEANGAVCDWAEERGLAQEAGTTLAAAVVKGSELHWISVGDSPLWLFRNGQLSRVNRSHNLAARLDLRAALGEIERREAVDDPDREALTSFVGIRELTQIDRSLQPLRLRAGDVVCLASDGLLSLSPDEIAEGLTTDPESAAEVLVRRTVQRGSENQDNVSMVALGLGETEEAAPAPLPEPAAPAATPRVPVGWWRVAIPVLIVLAGAVALAVAWWSGQAGEPPAATAPLVREPASGDAAGVTPPPPEELEIGSPGESPPQAPGPQPEPGGETGGSTSPEGDLDRTGPAIPETPGPSPAGAPKPPPGKPDGKPGGSGETP